MSVIENELPTIDELKAIDDMETCDHPRERDILYEVPESVVSGHADEPCVCKSDVWTSGCFEMDKHFVHFVVQTAIGIGLLTFCAYELESEKDCERSAPYWGLMGSICGFFFRNLAPASERLKH